jgi:U8 snoRNA-decapping enzyme
MQTITFDAKVDTKPQAAFVIFYALDGKPWENYPKDQLERHKLTIPVCLMLNRSDGTLGFIGGMVEEGETLEEAAKREVREEIGHTMTVDIKPLIAHDIGPITTHAFITEITYKQLRNIQEKAINGPHFGSEITGVFLPHLIDYDSTIGKGGGLINLLKTPMAPSVREELVHFLLKKNVVAKDSLSSLCERAGFNLVQLLE